MMRFELLEYPDSCDHVHNQKRGSQIQSTYFVNVQTEFGWDTADVCFTCLCNLLMGEEIVERVQIYRDLDSLNYHTEYDKKTLKNIYYMSA